MIDRSASYPADSPNVSALLVAERLAWGHSAHTRLGYLDHLTLDRGEALCVIGPNGVGKSTLLLTLTGRLRALGGQVMLAGADIERLRAAERARRVAFLPQTITTDPQLTVRELVELGRTVYLKSWGRLRRADREVIERALVACDLEHFAAYPIGRLSGGERQRARLAMAIAQEAPLLILDEPTTHLDLRRRAELFALLHKLRDQIGIAVVMALHELSDAFAQAGRVLLLSGGCAEELSSTHPQLRSKLAQAFGVDDDALRAYLRI